MSEDIAVFEVSESEELGKLVFANEVIASIASHAAFESAGIAGMNGGVVEGFAEMLGRKNLTKGVKVEVNGEEVSIEVYVTFKYGTKIYEAAKNMQRNVKNEVESMTGMHVERVTVYIQGVEFAKEPKPSKELKEVELPYDQ